MARTPKAAAPVERKLGDLVDLLWEERERKRQLNEHLKTVEAGIDALTSELIERMEKEGLDKATGKAASISVTPSIQPNIVDWDECLKFIVRTKHFEVLRRQLNPEPWRALMEAKGGKPDAVPGTVAFVKKTLNLRTLSK
jgi:hypothetical protein